MKESITRGDSFIGGSRNWASRSFTHFVKRASALICTFYRHNFDLGRYLYSRFQAVRNLKELKRNMLIEALKTMAAWGKLHGYAKC
ncbi:hypothetical protein AB3S75_035547 [Citrus x aurantiifolia]